MPKKERGSKFKPSNSANPSKESVKHIPWAGAVEIALASKIADEWASRLIKSSYKQGLALEWAKAIKVGHLDPTGRKTKLKATAIMQKFKMVEDMVKATGFGANTLPDGSIETVEDQISQHLELEVYKILKVCPNLRLPTARQ